MWGTEDDEFPPATTDAAVAVVVVPELIELLSEIEGGAAFLGVVLGTPLLFCG